MVPWHPPCALISLIFSSLRPETNCFSFLNVEVFACRLSSSLSLQFSRPAHSPFRNWPFFESFSVQLSRCVPRTLKTIQKPYFRKDFSANPVRHAVRILLPSVIAVDRRMNLTQSQFVCSTLSLPAPFSARILPFILPIDLG